MPALKYDGIINVATGQSRFEKKWKNRTIKWSELVTKISETTRTRETLAEYNAMPAKMKDNIKDVGGFVGGIVSGGRRVIGAVEERQLLTLDADHAPKDFDPGYSIDLALGCAAAWYSTHKHTDKAPRLRVVIPLSRKVNAEEYQALGRKVAEALGMDYFDDTTYQPHRLMYWPSTAADGQFIAEHVDGNWLDPDEWLGKYSDWTDASQWPVSSRQMHAVKKMAEKQGNPTEKPGIVGAFCRAYDVEEVIEKFLADKYIDAGDGRYTYTEGSTSAGVIVYEGGQFLYSHHATDPIGGLLVNAFDLLRVHKFQELDDEENVTDDTPINKRPSFDAMRRFAVTDPEVKKIVAKEQIESASEDFEDDLEDPNWVLELQLNQNGGIKSTARNIILILKHDSAIKDRFKFDEFAQRVVLVGDMPWRTMDKGRYWNDSDDAGIRNYLSHRYDIKGQGIIADAWKEIVTRQSFHPVKDYLNSLTWDGIERAETLLIDYLGAEDSPYTRAVTRKSLAAGVARIMRPGVKFDNVLVMVGPQGVGKSYILKKLGGEWFSDSLLTVQGKEAYEQLLGTWIIEMAELSATRKAESEAIKHFISKQEDIFRVSYDRHTSIFPRQCVFFGTTNDSRFLRDKTGNRRFWPVPVGVAQPSADMFKVLDKHQVDMIWAEAVELYRNGETLFLDKATEALATDIREQHSEEDPYVGVIQEYLETPIPEGWDELEPFQKTAYIKGETHAGQLRTKTCTMEIWVECFGGNRTNCTAQARRDISNALSKIDGWEPYEQHKKTLRFKQFGPQKAYVKVD